MKKLMTNTTSLILFALAALGSGYAQSNSGSCSDKLIAGNYAFTVQGTKLAGAGPTGPMVGVAMTEFDGKGGLSQIDTVTVDGEVVADWTHTRATGSYSVNSDCTGTFTINFTDGRPPVVANFVVGESGDEIDTVVISAGGNQGVLATGSIGKRRFGRH
ncbi:MAG: hypothetical protein WB711_12620 [Terriglobales bacterium]